MQTKRSKTITTMFLSPPAAVTTTARSLTGPTAAVLSTTAVNMINNASLERIEITNEISNDEVHTHTEQSWESYGFEKKECGWGPCEQTWENYGFDEKESGWGAWFFVP
ncbi:hypothetical protein ACA910_014863 [Epithemia clementina (nom. ined.)]